MRTLNSSSNTFLELARSTSGDGMISSDPSIGTSFMNLRSVLVSGLWFRIKIGSIRFNFET